MYKARNTVKQTTDNYRFAILKLIGLVGDLPISKLNANVIDQYKIHLLEKDLHLPSINSYLRCIRVFVNWLIQHDYIKPFKVTLMSSEREPIESYSDAELKLLLVKPPKKLFSEYRNWIAVNVLLGTGCRRHTLLNIKVGDVDFQNNTIILRVTKSRNAQIIPLSHTLAIILKEYINARKVREDDYLICNAFGGQMIQNGFTHEIFKYNRRHGVTKTSVHLFRHTFARMYLQAGGNVVYLSKILGHRDITTTMVYVNLFVDDLRKDFDRISPLEQIKSNHYI